MFFRGGTRSTGRSGCSATLWEPPCSGNNNCIPICPIGAKYDGAVHVAAAEKLGVKLLTSSVASHVAADFHRGQGALRASGPQR